MSIQSASFNIGQIIYHRNFDYRGVIIDIDYQYEGTDEWYAKHTVNFSSKQKPWYYILINDGDEIAYVAERNLEADIKQSPIRHPMINMMFSGYSSGKYQTRLLAN